MMIHKTISVIVVAALTLTGMPSNAFALRPMAHRAASFNTIHISDQAVGSAVSGEYLLQNPQMLQELVNRDSREYFLTEYERTEGNINQSPMLKMLFKDIPEQELHGYIYRLLKNRPEEKLKLGLLVKIVQFLRNRSLPDYLRQGAFNPNYRYSGESPYLCKILGNELGALGYINELVIGDRMRNGDYDGIGPLAAQELKKYTWLKGATVFKNPKGAFIFECDGIVRMGDAIYFIQAKYAYAGRSSSIRRQAVDISRAVKDIDRTFKNAMMLPDFKEQLTKCGINPEKYKIGGILFIWVFGKESSQQRLRGQLNDAITGLRGSRPPGKRNYSYPLIMFHDPKTAKCEPFFEGQSIISDISDYGAALQARYDSFIAQNIREAIKGMKRSTYTGALAEMRDIMTDQKLAAIVRAGFEKKMEIRDIGYCLGIATEQELLELLKQINSIKESSSITDAVYSWFNTIFPRIKTSTVVDILRNKGLFITEQDAENILELFKTLPSRLARPNIVIDLIIAKGVVWLHQNIQNDAGLRAIIAEINGYNEKPRDRVRSSSAGKSSMPVLIMEADMSHKRYYGIKLSSYGDDEVKLSLTLQTSAHKGGWRGIESESFNFSKEGLTSSNIIYICSKYEGLEDVLAPEIGPLDLPEEIKDAIRRELDTFKAYKNAYLRINEIIKDGNEHEGVRGMLLLAGINRPPDTDKYRAAVYYILDQISPAFSKLLNMKDLDGAKLKSGSDRSGYALLTLRDEAFKGYGLFEKALKVPGPERGFKYCALHNEDSKPSAVEIVCGHIKLLIHKEGLHEYFSNRSNAVNEFKFMILASGPQDENITLAQKILAELFAYTYELESGAVTWENVRHSLNMYVSQYITMDAIFEVSKIRKELEPLLDLLENISGYENPYESIRGIIALASISGSTGKIAELVDGISADDIAGVISELAKFFKHIHTNGINKMEVRLWIAKIMLRYLPSKGVARRGKISFLIDNRIKSCA